MNGLTVLPTVLPTVLASAAAGGALYLVTDSAVRRLNRSASRGVRLTGLVAVGVVLGAVIATAAFASRSAVLGFLVGALLTPPVHRRILRRRGRRFSG